MRLTNIANCRTINEYVNYKSQKLKNGEASFFALFKLMFSEESNTFWESNDGYRIIKKSYGEVKKSICQKAYSMQERLGCLDKGSVIGLHMQNSLEWIENFWAILMCGYCPLLLNTRIDKNILEDVIKSASTKAIISDGETFTVSTYMSKDIICTNSESSNSDFGEEILLMTSGTSNSVKICVYDAGSIINQILNAEQIVKVSRLVKKHYEGE